MGRRKKYSVELTETKESFLKDILQKGVHKARVLRRANILLLAHQDKPDRVVAEQLYVSEKTVANVRKKFHEGGLEKALFDAPRPGVQRKLNDKQEAHLIALACSKAPEGRTSWTMQLLADRMVELEIVSELSDETVRRTLKKTASNLGKRKAGVLGK